ncbi:MAG: FAD-binding oxidoreductase [Methylobacteriaceae bacterium]|nr:FAD-binding oxidoreductase [Methylobacteriaceae bacterium]
MTDPSSAPHPRVSEISTLVIGGGIVGTCLGGFLAGEGDDVAVIDAGWPAGSIANAGSIHVQMQSQFMSDYPQYIPRLERSLNLYRQAVPFWKRFQDDLGVDCELRITGGLMIAEDRRQLDFLSKKCRREVELGLDVAILTRPELAKLAPYLGPAVIGAEFCPAEGKVNPLLANTAIRRWANGRGAVLLHEEPVLRLELEGKAFRATTSRGIIRAGRVALAAGFASKDLAAQLSIELPAEADPLHMNITEGTTPFIGHLVQHADRPITLKQLGGGQVVIGGGWPAGLGTPGTIPIVKLSSIIGNVSLAQHIIPQIAQLRIIRTWAGINTFVDGCGILGRIDAVPGLFFAIPGSAGYTLGPLSARLVADCILGRDPSEDISACSVDRFSAP